jgi:hypothetical protein
MSLPISTFFMLDLYTFPSATIYILL